MGGRGGGRPVKLGTVADGKEINPVPCIVGPPDDGRGLGTSVVAGADIFTISLSPLAVGILLESTASLSKIDFGNVSDSAEVEGFDSGLLNCWGWLADGGPKPSLALRRSCFSQYCYLRLNFKVKINCNTEMLKYHPSPFVESIIEIVKDIYIFISPRVLIQSIKVNIECRHMSIETKFF